MSRIGKRRRGRGSVFFHRIRMRGYEISPSLRRQNQTFVCQFRIGFFYRDETSDQLFSRYGDKARYGIQLGSYRAEDLAEFTISLEVTYKEKAVVIG